MNFFGLKKWLCFQISTVIWSSGLRSWTRSQYCWFFHRSIAIFIVRWCWGVGRGARYRVGWWWWFWVFIWEVGRLSEGQGSTPWILRMFNLNIQPGVCKHYQRTTINFSFTQPPSRPTPSHLSCLREDLAVWTVCYLFGSWGVLYNW